MDDKVDEAKTALQAEASQANTSDSEEDKDQLTDEELKDVSGGSYPRF